MLDFFLVSLLTALVFLGLLHPAVAFTAYLWADLVSPQNITIGVASQIPFSDILAGVTVMSMVFNYRHLSRPTSWYILVALIGFLFWTHVTHTFSVYPDHSKFKLDWVTKSLGFSLVTLFMVNSKKSIEYFLIFYTVCVAYFSFSAGIKTLAGGGGYGRSLVIASSNNGLAESSTLAGVSAASIPYIYFFYKHSNLFRKSRIFKLICVGSILAFLFAVVGTFARTGLVCLFVLFVCGFFLSKQKLKLLLISVAAMATVVSLGGDEWRNRMGTIFEEEGSNPIIGRTEIWRWTIDYSKAKPLGGGFDAYLENMGQLEAYSKAINVQPQTRPRAFHNVYLEVLGEQGFPGLLIYMSIIFLSIWRLLKLRQPKTWQGADSETTTWATNLATASLISLLCLMTSGMFVGVAYRIYIFIPIIVAAGLSYEHRKVLFNNDRPITLNSA